MSPVRVKAAVFWEIAPHSSGSSRWRPAHCHQTSSEIGADLLTEKHIFVGEMTPLKDLDLTSKSLQMRNRNLFPRGQVWLKVPGAWTMNVKCSLSPSWWHIASS